MASIEIIASMLNTSLASGVAEKLWDVAREWLREKGVQGIPTAAKDLRSRYIG